MVEKASNVVLEHLRHIRAVVDETRTDVKRLALRMGLIERYLGGAQISEANQNIEIDRIKHRLERIERRLELVDD